CLVGGDLGIPGCSSTEHCAQRLLVNATSRWDQLTGQVTQHETREVTLEAEPTIDRERVGAGVGDSPDGIYPHEAVTDPGRVGIVAALPFGREVALRDHL